MDFDNCELVEQLLQSTGLSCEDLLLKLQTYRSLKSKPAEQANATCKEESKQNVSSNDSSNSLTVNSLSEEETNQIVSSNDISVILETKSSKIDDDKSNLESETKGNMDSSTTSASEPVKEDLPQESAEVTCLQQSCFEYNTGNNGCQKNESESVHTSDTFFNASECDITIEKVSAEEQEADSSKTQSETVDLEQSTKSSVRLSCRDILEETQKHDFNTSSEDHSQLSFRVQEQDKENNTSAKLSFGSEESSGELSQKNVDVTLNCQATLEKETAKEESNICGEDECSRLSSEAQERNSCETENESTSKITKSSIGPEESSIETLSKKTLIVVACQSIPEKEVSNICNEDNFAELSSEIYERTSCETESENNNKITKSSIDSEENFSDTSSQIQEAHPTVPGHQNTSGKEITENAYDLLTKTDESRLSSEVKIQDNHETQKDEVSKITKFALDLENNSDKTAAENVDNSQNCQSTLEHQMTERDSNVLCEADHLKLSLQVQKQNSCGPQKENSNEITKPCIDNDPNCQQTADKESTKKHSNILNEDNTSVQSSSKNIFGINHETNDTIKKTLSDDGHNAKNLNDHDYSNAAVSTGSLPEREETSSSDFDTERETSPLKTDDLPKSEDSLRDVLRMQLSSLRNMKKSTGLLPTFKKTMFFQSLKKKRKSCDINPVVPTDVDGEKESNDKDMKGRKFDENTDNCSTNENSLVSLSDNTDFVILDVSGGVDRLTPNIEFEGNEESMFASATHTENEEKGQEDVLNSVCSTSEDRDTPKVDETSNSSDNNSLNSALTSRNEKPVQLTVRKNISVNFTRDPGINKSVKNSEKSPFVSDSLEDFLNESSVLKISYAIPKLGAEEGITENTKKCPFDDVVNSQTPKIEQENTQREKPKLIKAKTLADMRRHFEKLKAAEDKQAIDSPSQYKKKRVFKRKFLNIEKGETKSQDKLTETNSIRNTSIIRLTENTLPRNSYIIYNNKKLWVPCKVGDKCLGNVHSKTNKEVLHEKTVTPPSPKPEQISIRKPSLLSSLTKNKLCTVKYKPGPMCKKADLQNVESKAHWTTELKILPKIYLEVVPEVQKPIDPSIVHLLPIFDEPVITEERINFALSTLKPKNTNETKESFNFHIPFNNKQEKIIVRKPFKPDVVCKANSEDKETDPEGEISKIINDLITYVEIKEIADTVIKEDDPTTDLETFTESSLKTKTRKVKRRKLDLELQRLNCKVIDVATDKEDTDCTKPSCRLGCVCKSLLCESVFSNHCQLVECMFGCTCPSNISNSLTGTSNSLSVYTVNHLEDKAKKNLARVEKEFTQTYIHTDNDAILVGTARVRRSTKPPKKYTDFVGDDVFDTSPSILSEKEPLKCKKFDLVLDNLPLNDVIPFCLFHNVHNCICKGETEIVSTNKTKEIDQIPKIRIVKTKEDQHKAWYDSCARIRKVFPEYKERNKTALYKDKLRKGNLSYRGRRGPKKKQQKEETYVENQAEQMPEINVIEFDVMNKESPKINRKPSKRKQSFDIREDVLLPLAPADKNEQEFSPDKNEKEFALQRRKKKVKSNIVPVETQSYQPIFDGEIKVSLAENKEMLNIIGNENSSLEFLRILPWEKLIQSFWLGKICIWAKDKPSSPLLCNSAGYFPPKNFVSITRVTQKSEIINWILTDSLPPDRPRDLMHLILTPKNMHFLIAGYCLKKIYKNTTPLEKQNDFLNKCPTPARELPPATDPMEISRSSSSVDCTDVDVDTVENVGISTSSDTESRNRIHTNSNQRPVLSTSAPPEVQISVVSKPLSAVAENLSLLKPGILKLPDSSTSLNSISRKNRTTNKPTTLFPRKGIANRKSTTKITTKRTYVKVGSMFNSLQSGVNKNDVSKVSTPTIKQVVNAPRSTLNASTVSLLGGTRVRPLLPKDIEDNQNLSTLSATLSALLEKSANMMVEINSSEMESNNPLHTESELSVNTEKGEEASSTTSSTSVEMQSIATRDLAKTVSVSGQDHVQTTASDKEIVSKKHSQDPLEITVVDKSPPKKPAEEPKRSSEEQKQCTEEQKQTPVRNNENNAKKSTRDPLEVTEKDSSTSHQEETVKSLKDKDTRPTKRTKTSSNNSSINKNRITSQSGVIPSRSLKCTHKDMNNQSKTLVLTNKVFNQRKIYFTKDDIKALEITVALPPVSKSCKWRMIYLNSDFTFLTFMTVNYSIKYTDLMDVVKMSSNIKSTITLRNKEFSDTFKHPLFGIYCVADYQDRLFIGPYVPSEKHNIETLRYLQGRLIDTQIFNKMVGRNGSEKNPLWLYETSPRPLSLPNGLVIDITEDDEAHEITVVDLDSDSCEETQNTSSKSQDLENTLLFPPFVEELTQEELKTRHSINRYIMTNIPHLGYFDACQRDSKAIEVFWPDGSKGYRFPNVTFAKNLLTRYLSQIFCPIPQDFKLNVIIMTNLGVQINKPIDSKYLSRPGPYFCGEFGIYEKDAIPDSLLKKYNVPSIDSLLMSHKELQEDEDAMIRIFGLFLMSNEELRKHSEPYKILQWAISETYILKKLAENYDSEKTDLQNMIRAKTQKIKEKRKDVRTEEAPTSKRVNTSETIEIRDSDEEDSQKTNSEVTGPRFKRISISGRIETDNVYDQNKSRSLLKSNLIKPGRSLLKSNDRTRQKITSPEKPASVEPVKISLKNSNIILKKNNVLITKLK